MKLPPYGLLSEEYKKALSNNPMGDWKLKKKDFHKLVSDINSEIAANIWPFWDRESGQWSGDAKAFADDATKAELEIMVDKFQRVGVLNEKPSVSSTLSAARQRSHDWHFRVEDGFIFRISDQKKIAPEQEEILKDNIRGSTSWGANFYFYYDEMKHGTFPKRFFKKPTDKIHGLFNFKPHFARPRPYQAAMILGVDKFQHHIAKTGTHTGTHPSLMSGHCVQGMMLTCHVLEQMLEMKLGNEEEFDAMAQYAVDFGDRRVFAGVHYPSDNIASWIIAMRFIPHTFKDDHVAQIMAFARKAITEKSLVYRTIQQSFPHYAALAHSLNYLNDQILVSAA